MAASSFTPTARTVATTVTGLRDPLSTLSNRIKPDVRDEILLWEPNAAPLTLLTKAFRERRQVENPTFDWIEKDQKPREVEIEGAQTNSDTSIEVVAGQGVRVAKFDVLLNRRTREAFIVTAVSTDTLTVVRGLGAGASDAPSTGVAMNDADLCEIIGNAYEDGDTKGVLKSIKEARNYNFCQIIRQPFGWTRRQKNIGLFGGNDPMTERRWQGIEHKKAIELTAFFGKRNKGLDGTDGANGRAQDTAGGLEEFISSNVYDCGGSEPSKRQFVEFMEEVMKYGEGGYMSGRDAHKWGFFSRRLCTVIEGWAEATGSQVNYTPRDKVLGLRVGTFQSTHGELSIVPMNIFAGLHSKFGFIVDPNHVRFVHMKGGDTQLKTEIEDPSLDGSEEEYLTDCSWEVSIEGAHGLIKNF